MRRRYQRTRPEHRVAPPPPRMPVPVRRRPLRPPPKKEQAQILAAGSVAPPLIPNMPQLNVSMRSNFRRRGGQHRGGRRARCHRLAPSQVQPETLLAHRRATRRATRNKAFTKDRADGEQTQGTKDRDSGYERRGTGGTCRAKGGVDGSRRGGEAEGLGRTAVGGVMPPVHPAAGHDRQLGRIGHALLLSAIAVGASSHVSQSGSVRTTGIAVSWMAAPGHWARWSG
jgi:hypothetical protein